VWLAEYHQILPLILRDTHDLEAELEQLVMDARRTPGFSALIRRISAE
jgi:hypothetical protein